MKIAMSLSMFHTAPPSQAVVRAATALLVVIVSLGCSAKVEPADPATLQPSTFILAGTKYTLLVPAAAQSGLTATSSGQEQVTFAFAPEARVNPLLTLVASLPNDPPVESRMSIALDGGARLRYEVSEQPAAGTGGGAALLRGDLQFDNGPRLNVLCSTQAENDGDARWCVQYLHHLARAGR
jgi:hypothetical protein